MKTNTLWNDVIAGGLKMGLIAATGLGGLAAHGLYADEHMKEDSAQPERILIVVTNHGVLGETGKRTGWYMPEVAHPWKVFTEAGYAVDFASPNGGFAPMDPSSFNLEDESNKEFWHTLDAVEGVFATHALNALDLSVYEAIFFAGGHGTMWDFADSEAVQSAIARIYEANGAVGAVCHGPAALAEVRLSDGSYLVDGRRVTGFTNEEESAVNLVDVMPFLLETRLRERGAKWVEAPNFEEKVAVDGRLVTGQNPASAEGAAKAIVAVLKERD